jgi:hypothetical protein
MVPSGRELVRCLLAYHGEIVVDPANGTIMRLSAKADFKAPCEQARAAILVEYALDAIGDRRYVCPVKGVAFSKMPAFQEQTKSEIPNVRSHGRAERSGIYPLSPVSYPNAHPRRQVAVTSSVPEKR